MIFWSILWPDDIARSFLDALLKKTMAELQPLLRSHSCNVIPDRHCCLRLPFWFLFSEPGKLLYDRAQYLCHSPGAFSVNVQQQRMVSIFLPQPRLAID